MTDKIMDLMLGACIGVVLTLSALVTMMCYI